MFIYSIVRLTHYCILQVYNVAMTSGAIRKHKDKKDKKTHEKKLKKKKKLNKSVPGEVRSF